VLALYGRRLHSLFRRSRLPAVRPPENG
jgi:hypothetical protein